ncbi:MAG: hypothetical protein FJZ92_04515 [Chloroflexi bacterium]|nr:hypothetical protein [Chloroflexota bacterium]
MTGSHFPAEFATALAASGEGTWGARLVRLLEKYPHFAVLGSESECLPYPENRVELADEVDEFDVPRPKVPCSFGENERALRAEEQRRGRAVLEAAGAEEIFVSEGTDHALGGCRIGDDPADSVVDENLKAHDHPNLYICDASVFATSAGAQPSQTIMTLAARLADHLIRSRHRG